MKNILCLFLALFAFQTGFAAPAAAPANAQVRTIKTLPHFPRESLAASINRPLYRALEISPIEAWLMARAPIYGAHTGGARIIHSDAGGIYDKMLLDRANGYTVTGTNHIESRLPTDSLMVHLIIFKIKDGLLGICFAHSEDARYVGYKQSSPAWIGISQKGQWRTVSRTDRR